MQLSIVYLLAAGHFYGHVDTIANMLSSQQQMYITVLYIPLQDSDNTAAQDDTTSKVRT